MTLPSSRQLQEDAGRQLSKAREPQKIVLIYTAILIGTSAVSTIAQYLLGSGISQTGGLRNLGLRSMLSTVSNILPIAQYVILLCLGLGFAAAALRIARGQFASPKTLKAGFERFWPLAKCTLLQSLILLAVGFGSFYLAMAIYMFSPFSEGFFTIITPLLADESILSTGIPVLDEATSLALMDQMWPMFIIFGILFLALAIPVTYRYRLVNYLIIDRPGIGAFAALRTSNSLMKGNKRRFFRLDLSFWWYYVLLSLASVVCYGDLVLAMLGISLPMSSTVSYFLFYALFLAADFGIYWFFLNRVEVTYALAYDALIPKQSNSSGGVVLGNIFDLARQQ
ncbi:MAG: DUF975 family protein [Faecousia sp.]